VGRLKASERRRFLRPFHARARGGITSWCKLVEDLHKAFGPRSSAALFFFSACFDSRVSSTPFSLFQPVILTPVRSRAYSPPATLFCLTRKSK
jgi:hypothetical protein